MAEWLGFRYSHPTAWIQSRPREPTTATTTKGLLKGAEKEILLVGLEFVFQLPSNVPILLNKQFWRVKSVKYVNI